MNINQEDDYGSESFRTLRKTSDLRELLTEAAEMIATLLIYYDPAIDTQSDKAREIVARLRKAAEELK